MSVTTSSQPVKPTVGEIESYIGMLSQPGMVHSSVHHYQLIIAEAVRLILSKVYKAHFVIPHSINFIESEMAGLVCSTELQHFLDGCSPQMYGPIGTPENVFRVVFYFLAEFGEACEGLSVYGQAFFVCGEEGYFLFQVKLECKPEYGHQHEQNIWFAYPCFQQKRPPRFAGDFDFEEVPVKAEFPEWIQSPDQMRYWKKTEKRSLNPQSGTTHLVDWEIFPPEEDVLRLVDTDSKQKNGGGRAGAELRRDRLKKLVSLQPLRIWRGRVLERNSGEYTVFEFGGVVIAESDRYGNAIFWIPKAKQEALEPLWQTVFGSTKTVAQQKGAQKIIHVEGWFEKIQQIVMVSGG